MLLVQNYLLAGKSLQDLENDHGVNSHVYNGKISLNYDQILAKESDPIAQECRGLILRETDYSIVAFPLRRFFNEEQGAKADLDWSTATLPEKLDGTMIVIYFDHMANHWFVATRSRPEAIVPIDDSKITFTDLANQTIEFMSGGKFKSVHEYFSTLSTDIQDTTFIFELTSPFNHIVCHYKELKLTLLAVRNNKTLLESDPKEMLPRISHGINFTVPEEHPLSDIAAIKKMVAEWNPIEREGVIAKDANFNRVKIKSPNYVALHGLKDSINCSLRSCVQLVLDGKDDDVIAALGDAVVARMDMIRNGVRKLFIEVDEKYSQVSQIEGMKEFALAVQKMNPSFSGYFFMRKRGKINGFMEYLWEKDGSYMKSTLDQVAEYCEKAADRNVEQV